VRSGASPEGSTRDLVGGVEIGLEVATDGDEEQERQRLRSELAKLEQEIDRARERLANRQFLEKAPAEVVDGNRRRLAEMEDRRSRMRDALGS